MDSLVTFFTFDNLVGLFLSLVMVPFFLPTIRDTFCAMYIWLLNKKRGRPTYKRGEQYTGLLFANGYFLPNVWIVNVDFKMVTFHSSEGHVVQVKKSHLVSGKVTPFHSKKFLKV